METNGTNKNGHSGNGYRYLFDDFEIDSANRTLLRNGVEVPLTGKVFDILWVFVENPSRLLEKNELLEKVWPGNFVEEGNLARNVSTLRKALGDTGKEHKYVATVQGHGYRFIADVVSPDHHAGPPLEELDPKSDQIAANNGNRRIQFDDRPQADLEIHPVEPIRTQLYRRPWLFSIAAVCLIGAVVVAFSLQGHKPRQIDQFSFERLRKTKLTQDGNFYGGLISPDGQYLASTRINNNERTLSVREMATGSILDLQPPQSGASYWAMAFAPDNSFLYYILNEQNEDYGNIYRIPLLGGQRRKLVSYADGGLTVSPDGSKLAFTRIDRQKGTTSIIVAATDGTNEQTISSSDLDSLYYSLDWAPDGNSFVYSFKRHDQGHEYWYLAEIPATGGVEQMIGEPSDSTILMAKWLPDKSGLIVSAIDETAREPQIYAVSYPDGAKRRITNDLYGYSGFSMTTDGRSIVLPYLNANRQIWEMPNGNNGSATQISNGNEKHFDSVSWLRNEYLVFDEDGDNSFIKFNIYRMRPDGTDLQQLTFGTGNNTQPAVSPDGEIIVFVSSRSGMRQLWRMDADGRNVTQLNDIANNVIRPVFSGDGQTVFFSVSIAGKCNIWKVSIGGGSASVVTDADVYQWAISPDGTKLAYSSFDKQAEAVRTHILSLQQASPDIIFNISPETWMEWSNDGNSLDFNTAQDGALNIWRQPLDGSAPRPITKFNTEQVFRFVSSPNGKNLTCIRHTTTYDAVILHFD